MIPVSQTLFYFTEDSVKEADEPKKGAIVFLRSCDLHAVKRLDDMYLKNGPEDYYYERVREKIHFVLIGCSQAFDSCFCVDMGTNVSTNYDLSIGRVKDQYLIDCKWEKVESLLDEYAQGQQEVTPEYVTETKIKVNIPRNLDASITKSSMWRECDLKYCTKFSITNKEMDIICALAAGDVMIFVQNIYHFLIVLISWKMA